MHALVLEVPISLFAICIIPAKNRYRKTNIIHYHSKWPANNCLQIMVCSCAMSSNCVWLQIIFCSCVNETTRDRSCVKKGRSLRFPKIFIKKQTWWSNDKTIIELGYRKISWFVSVSQINYLPQPSASANNWSARHWQITIFCSTSSNNC